jgi:hypothetical protein
LLARNSAACSNDHATTSSSYRVPIPHSVRY